MVVVAVAMAFCANFDMDEGMTRQLIEHMIKKTDAGCDIGEARSIEVETDFDVRLLSLACDCALAHGDFEALSCVCAGVIARRAPLGHLSFDDTDAAPRWCGFRDA